MPSDAENTYDVIIIGSGISGLTCASLLASLYQKKVLVLEQHGKLGGFTHTFKRKIKYEWDVGLHYVGSLQSGKPVRAFFDLITAGQVHWQKMPDPYDVFVYPDLTFPLREGEETVKQDLIHLFPEEEISIRRYFRDLHKAVRWSVRYAAGLLLPHWLKGFAALLSKPGRRQATALTADYLDRHFHDERLKAILTSQWGDYGLPPGQSAFVIHAMIVLHYINGAYYPLGGARKIAESILPVVEGKGGALLVRHRVTEILIEGNRVRGVRCSEKQGGELREKEFFADMVISAIGALSTYRNLLPAAIAAARLEELEKLPAGISSVSLYIGLRDDPATIGWKGENYWLFDEFDHDNLFAGRNDLLQGKVKLLYLSFPSKKNPDAAAHTMEILAFVDYQPFRAWAAQPVKKRDEAYQELKERIARTMIEYVESRFSGFEALIDFYELGTPLTIEHYTAHPAGIIYGIPATPARFHSESIGFRTPVKNLYLTGSDTSGHGITGAMMSGVLTTAMIGGLPWQLIKIFSQAQKFHSRLKDQHADH